MKAGKAQLETLLNDLKPTGGAYTACMKDVHVWFDHNNLQRLQQVDEEIRTTEFPMNDVIGILMASNMPNQNGDFVQLQHNLDELAHVDNPLFQHAMNIGSLSVLQNRLQMPAMRY